jgi:phosphate transport system substrate-binding protein
MNKAIRKIITLVMAGAVLFTVTACAPDAGTPQTTQPTSGATTATTGMTTGVGTTGTTTAPLAGKIVASGSTSMEELMTALGEAFTVINPDVSVEIQGGGSSTGVKNASNGVTEIGNSSRALKADEKSLGLTEHVVALDGIAVVVNAANPVSDLTTAQIADIFTGKITNWKDVGGQDAAIVVVVRESGSGTRDGFEDILKIKDQCVETQVANETGIVKSTVAGNELAIGYMSLGKVDQSVKALQVGGVVASEASVLDKTYILQRPFLCLTKGEESGLVKAFFTFVMSDAGQTLVEQKGYVPVQ